MPCWRRQGTNAQVVSAAVHRSRAQCRTYTIHACKLSQPLRANEGRKASAPQTVKAHMRAGARREGMLPGVPPAGHSMPNQALQRRAGQTARCQLLAAVRCDVPGRCSLKRVVHPGDFRQSESSQTNRLTGRNPDGRSQECAKLSGESSTAGQTSPRTRMDGARGVGGRRYE